MDGRVGPMALIGLIYLRSHFKQPTLRLVDVEHACVAAAAVTVAGRSVCEVTGGRTGLICGYYGSHILMRGSISDRRRPFGDARCLIQRQTCSNSC